MKHDGKNTSGSVQAVSFQDTTTEKHNSESSLKAMVTKLGQQLDKLCQIVGKATQEQARSHSPSPLRCYQCQELNHMARECRAQKRTRDSREESPQRHQCGPPSSGLF